MTQVTMQQVAQLAGVSSKTVSRVINHEQGVSLDTKEKVLFAIKQLNYSPNTSARSLAAKRSYLIALLYDNPSPYYILDIQQGVLTACEDQGYHLLIQPCLSAKSSNLVQLQQFVHNSRVDGVILTSPLADNYEMIQFLLKQQLPFALVGVNHQQFNSIYCNDDHAVFSLVQQLIALGHQRIAFIQGLLSHNASHRRYQGYLQALQDASIDLDPALVIQGQFDFNSGCRAAETLFALTQRPTAIVASNDDMAAGVVYTAKKQQIAIPQQLSVAGFDDSPLAQQIYPNLTTVQQPTEQMANYATTKLIEQLQQKNPITIHQQFDCQLKLRDSLEQAY